MPETSAVSGSRTNGTKYRIRRDVYDSLTREKNAHTVSEQVQLIGLPRATLFRIRRGDPPSLDSAMRISDALGVPLAALFERVGES